MDEQAQQQIPHAAAPPIAPVPPIPVDVASAPPAERFPAPQPGVAGRYARLLLRRLLRGADLAWGVLGPRIGWVLAVLLLLGIIAAQGLFLILPRLIAASSGDSRVEHLAPSAAVEAFLDGQANYDADVMWDALSPELQGAMTQRGGSKEALAAQTESERAAGQRYRSVEYVGGVPLDNNQRRYFYVVDIVSPAPERSGLFTFIFTTDRDGKILDLKMGN